MKNMSDEQLSTESVDETGSSVNTDPSEKEGESVDESESAEHWKSSYEELQKVFGTQGTELGEYRDWFKGMEPILSALDSDPDLMQAIIDKKVDSELIEAALEGRITINDAANVAKANEEVKKEVGNKEYNKMSSDEIEKLVADRAAEIEKKVQYQFDQERDIRSFSDSFDSFVSSHDDFNEYAAEIDKWLDEHPDQLDISVAYEAVKGRVLVEQTEKAKENGDAEVAKEAAAAAAGGQSQSSGGVTKDKDIIDEYLGKGTPPSEVQF